MSHILPPVGTNLLLESVSGCVPDDFIAGLCVRDFTGGRRHVLSGPQLWRVHLLALLTSTHSLNLVVAQLSEQPGWRRFARLRRIYPTARMLHEFRQQVGVDGLRAIDRHLLGRLLRRQGRQPHSVALMDATDLPAACSGFKKKFRALHGKPCRTGRTHAQDRPKPLVWQSRPNSAGIVGNHPPVRAISSFLPEDTKRSLDCFPWEAASCNSYCNKFVRGSNRRSPLRKTNWAWVRCSSTAFGSPGR